MLSGEVYSTIGGGQHSPPGVADQGRELESMDSPSGVDIGDGGSLTMTKCTSTGGTINVLEGASLVIEDCHVFDNNTGGSSNGVHCSGDVKATRCTVEGNGATGVYNYGAGASGELVDCMIRQNGDGGVSVSRGKVVLRGSTSSENHMNGVNAHYAGKVTVAKAEEDGLLRTVCKDNERGNWGTEADGEIIGIPQEKIHDEYSDDYLISTLLRPRFSC